MSRFAADTEVSVEKSRAELEGLLAKHGATQRATYTDDERGLASVGFRIADRMVRLEVHCPTRESFRPKTWRDSPPAPRGAWRWSESERNAWLTKQAEQGARTAWRRLLLVVKAKLELIADGGSTFEREFLADILLADGRTVHQFLAEQLDETYRTGTMPKLLPGMGDT